MDMPRPKSRLYQIPMKKNPGDEALAKSDKRRKGKQGGLSHNSSASPEGRNGHHASRKGDARWAAGVWSNEDRQKRPVRHPDERGEDCHNPPQVRIGENGNGSSRNRAVESDDNLSAESEPLHSNHPNNEENEEDLEQEESTNGLPVLKTDRRDALGLVEIYPDNRRQANHDDEASAADEVTEYLLARPRPDKASKEDGRGKTDTDRKLRSSPSPGRRRQSARAPSSRRRSPSPDIAPSKKSVSPDFAEMEDRSRDQQSNSLKPQGSSSSKRSPSPDYASWKKSVSPDFAKMEDRSRDQRKSSPSPDRRRQSARAPSSRRRSPSPDIAPSKKSVSPDFAKMEDRSRDQQSNSLKPQGSSSKKSISPPAAPELGSSSL